MQTFLLSKHGAHGPPSTLCTYLVVVFSFLKCCQSAKQTKQQKKKSSEKNYYLSVSFVSEHEKVSFEVFLTSCKKIRSKTYVNYSGSVLSLPGKKPPSPQNKTMQQQLIQAHSAAAVPKMEGGGGKQKRGSICYGAEKRIQAHSAAAVPEMDGGGGKQNRGYIFVMEPRNTAFRRRRPENGRRRKTKMRVHFRYGVAVPAATLRTRHKRGRRGGRNSGQVNLAVHCANEWQLFWKPLCRIGLLRFSRIYLDRFRE
jgi:hypothetical protein